MKNLPMFGLAMGWIGVLAVGTAISATYENKPGDPASAPAIAISTDGVEPAKSSKATFHIIMFVHPKCPCTRASMAELRNLMEKFPDLKATVFFYRPASEKTGWEKTEIWKMASSVKNIDPQIDVDGQKAKSYRAVTSGQVLLYDTSERLVFSGGITGARGHVGENVGEDMVAGVLAKRSSAIGKNFRAPVFGCRILTDGTELCISKKQ